MNYRKELVSIIIPTYNSAFYLQETIESVLKQSYLNIEIIIVDDASRDKTVEIIRKYVYSDTRIVYFQLVENQGAAVARNKAIELAKGQYLAFLDADDMWKPDKLSRQLQFMKDNISVFSFTAYDLVDQDGLELNRTIDLHCPDILAYEDMLLKKATLGCSTVVLDRTNMKDLRMPLYRTAQDYALWLRILKQGVVAHSFKESLSSYRIVKNSISRNKFKKALRQWEIYRVDQQISLTKTIWYFLNYAFRAVFRS